MKWLRLMKWQYATRATGLFLIFYELLGVSDKSPDRGTIIVVAVGLLGSEFVVKRDREHKE